MLKLLDYKSFFFRFQSKRAYHFWKLTLNLRYRPICSQNILRWVKIRRRRFTRLVNFAMTERWGSWNVDYMKKKIYHTQEIAGISDSSTWLCSDSRVRMVKYHLNWQTRLCFWTEPIQTNRHTDRHTKTHSRSVQTCLVI